MPKILKIHEVSKALLGSYKRNKPESHSDDTCSSYSKHCIDVSGEAIFITNNSGEEYKYMILTKNPIQLSNL
jgi:hypothetical protein